MAHHVVYCTSHDVEADLQQRLYSYFLQTSGRNPSEEVDPLVLEQVFSALALTLTAAGVPMFLAGEEFADLHDTDRRNWRHKMSDPVDWSRADTVGRRELVARVSDLIQMRTAHPALHRNEVVFFGFNASQNPGFHPAFDENDGRRLFAYCRTEGTPLGSPGQVVVVGNCRQDDYPEVWVDWPWGFRPTLRERGSAGHAIPFVEGARARMQLRPFQVRVFEV
jgi:hypothetical protein